jgi:hypothetical protein
MLLLWIENPENFGELHLWTETMQTTEATAVEIGKAVTTRVTVCREIKMDVDIEVARTEGQALLTNMEATLAAVIVAAAMAISRGETIHRLMKMTMKGLAATSGSVAETAARMTKGDGISAPQR